MSDIIYFDNSATTKIYPEVLSEMNRIYSSFFGNPSSLHRLGGEAEKVLLESREIIAKTLKVSPNEIFFTSGGTESNNWAIKGAARANKRRGKHLITSGAEHPSVLECFNFLKSEGFSAEITKTDQSGLLNRENFIEKITDNTTLTSFILVNNETGAIQKAEELIAAIRSINKNTVIHIDAVQAYGKIPLDLRKIDADIVSLSAHKIHGPKGCGALYIRENTRIIPILHGGGQENSYRSGTENVPAIWGFAIAAKIINENIDENRNKVRRLKSIVISELDKFFGSGEYFVNSPPDAYEGIVNISFKNVKAQVLMQHLEAESIIVSTGSACSSRKNMQSHVLSAMNLPMERTEGAIRISFSGMNTEDEALMFAEAIKKIVPKIRYR
ncbi:MAG: cysteine desulfurase family protein [Bacillota bacterium]|nr:cysteine desulfurase family protein [Bacillota bacterium]NLV64058.1 cysteine desulfurase [Clostridiaceae bacterium]